MALENKLGITDSTALAREEEKISTKKALEISYDAVLPDALSGDGATTDNSGNAQKPAELSKVTGTITDIRSAVVNGNSIYYIAVDNKPVYYSIAASEDDNVVILNVGDKVNISYVASSEAIVTAKEIKK